MLEVVYALGIALAFYYAWNMGANDAANPTDCAVGSGVLSLKKAFILFAIFTATGGIILGPFVMKTIDRGLIAREELETQKLILGSFVASLAACLWVTFSSWKGMPVSTTHSVIGGVLGFGLLISPGLINHGVLFTVILSLLLSPLLSILLSFGLFRPARNYFSRERKHGNVILVYFVTYFLSFITSVSVLYKLLEWDKLSAVVGSLTISFLPPSILITSMWKKYKTFKNEFVLSSLLIVSLCFSALSFGANDMANATGVFVTPTQRLIGEPTLLTMFLLSILGATGILIGGLTWGYRVISTCAYRVTRLDPLMGMVAEFSNALTVFLFTVVPTFLMGFGIPVSTTHSSIGTIIGVGLARGGMGALHKPTTLKILLFWILTIPCVALLSIVLFVLLGHGLGIA